MTLPEDHSPPGLQRWVGPEIIAIVLAVVIVGIIGASTQVRGSSAPSEGASPRPTISSGPTTPTASPIVDPTVVALLRALNQKLEDHAQALRESLDGSFRTAEVASTIRQLNALVLVGSDAVSALRGALGQDEVGDRLRRLYQALTDSATDTLGASITNDTEYRLGAEVLVELIGGLAALQAELDALARPLPSPTPGPTPSAPPSATPPPPTASPSPTPTIEPSASPSSRPSGAPTPVPGDQIVDGGFESGVGSPWLLRVAPDASATVQADTADPAAGRSAARIDIALGSTAYAGISLVQAGLHVDAGAQYTVSVAVRAAAGRDIRIRIASGDGASYLTRLVTASTTWTTQAFVFIAPVSDTAAVLEVDFGRSSATTWLDTVSFAPLGAPVASP